MIANRCSTLQRLINRLAPNGERLCFCYEAGPCPIFNKIFDKFVKFHCFCDLPEYFFFNFNKL